MSEYTPTTDEVRKHWLGKWTPSESLDAQFDRWLAGVERAAAARAWDEGFDAAEEDWAHHDRAGWGNEECLDKTRNPYRAAETEERRQS